VPLVKDGVVLGKSSDDGQALGIPALHDSWSDVLSQLRSIRYPNHSGKMIENIKVNLLLTAMPDPKGSTQGGKSRTAVGLGALKTLPPKCNIGVQRS
jgi:hypothetical protein